MEIQNHKNSNFLNYNFDTLNAPLLDTSCKVMPFFSVGQTKGQVLLHPKSYKNSKPLIRYTKDYDSLEVKLFISNGIQNASRFNMELILFPGVCVKIKNRKIDASGIVICINDNTNEIVSIANMDKDGKVDGELQIFPNGIFSVKCMVKNGILNGKCIMKFQPYRHGYNPQERILDPSYDPLYKNKVSQETSPDFKLETVGTYKNGERFDGEFLKVNTFGLYREVIITTYKDGKIMKNSKPQYFKTQGRNVVE